MAAASILCCMPGTGTQISPTWKGIIPMQSVGSRCALYIGSSKRDGSWPFGKVSRRRWCLRKELSLEKWTRVSRKERPYRHESPKNLALALTPGGWWGVTVHFRPRRKADVSWNALVLVHYSLTCVRGLGVHGRNTRLRVWQSRRRPQSLTHVPLTLNKSLPLSELQLPHWQVGDSKTSLTGLMGRVREMMNKKVACKLKCFADYWTSCILQSFIYIHCIRFRS